MARRTQLSRLLKRDGYRCGIHFGGCGEGALSRADGSVDHIFTRSFFGDREGSITAKDYNRDWNCQPMHRECNTKRGGQIYGFPVFNCVCHWLQIVRTSEGHVLELHCRTDEGVSTIQVCSEEHRFVFNNPSTGAFSEELGGNSEAVTSSTWSIPDLKPGKGGIVGRGQMGHAFPRISPGEVRLFNLLELQRIEGGSSEKIEVFNRRMNPMSMEIHFTVVEEAE